MNVEVSVKLPDCYNFSLTFHQHHSFFIEITSSRDIVDIEYRTLQLRIVAQRGAAVRDRLVYKESSSERCLVLQKNVVCCFVSRKSCTHGGKRCSRGRADLAPPQVMTGSSKRGVQALPAPAS